MGFASWLPTYSIKAGIADASSAAVFTLYFWLANTIARLFWTFLTMYSVTQRLKVILMTVTATSILLVLLQSLELYYLVCTIGPVVFGFMVSCVYSFCVALPIDNGFQSTVSNTANFLLANCIGEGLLNAPMGYSMNIFGFQSLMVIIMISCMVSYYCFNQAVQSFKEEKESHSGIQMELI